MPVGEPGASAADAVGAAETPAASLQRPVAPARRSLIEPAEPAELAEPVRATDEVRAPGGGPRIAPPSDDVATAQTVALPGEHRGGFRRELTEPVPITATVRTDQDWIPETGPAVAVRLPRSAGGALAFGILGVLVSLVVGWGFLLGLVGAVLAIIALRRPWESRQAAVWALCLSLVSLVYSAGWLWWASTQGPLFG